MNRSSVAKFTPLMYSGVGNQVHELCCDKVSRAYLIVGLCVCCLHPSSIGISFSMEKEPNSLYLCEKKNWWCLFWIPQNDPHLSKINNWMKSVNLEPGRNQADTLANVDLHSRNLGVTWPRYLEVDLQLPLIIWFLIWRIWWANLVWICCLYCSKVYVVFEVCIDQGINEISVKFFARLRSSMIVWL